MRRVLQVLLQRLVATLPTVQRLVAQKTCDIIGITAEWVEEEACFRELEEIHVSPSIPLCGTRSWGTYIVGRDGLVRPTQGLGGARVRVGEFALVGRLERRKAALVGKELPCDIRKRHRERYVEKRSSCCRDASMESRSRLATDARQDAQEGGGVSLAKLHGH